MFDCDGVLVDSEIINNEIVAQLATLAGSKTTFEDSVRLYMVATLIDKEADAKSAAAQLGHASEDVTNTYYIVKPALAPDSSHILEQLGASPTTTGPERAGDRPTPAT